MNKNILTFVLGFISGSAATVIFAKKYYEKVANDEIEQVKETYARKAEIEEAGKIDEDLKAVDKVIKEHQYNTVINTLFTNKDEILRAKEALDAAVEKDKRNKEDRDELLESIKAMLED